MARLLKELSAYGSGRTHCINVPRLMHRPRDKKQGLCEICFARAARIQAACRDPRAGPIHTKLPLRITRRGA